jgi:hypothetical protein
MHPLLILQLTVMLALANTTPLIAKKILGSRFAWPLDGGVRFFDGRPLLGSSKTIRGVALAVIVTSAGAPLVGLDVEIGALAGSVAMAGDLFSSFVKRRLDMPPSSKAVGLDQIPESLFPLLGCRWTLPLTLADIAVVVAIFFVGEVVLSRFFYRLGLRDRPY